MKVSFGIEDFKLQPAVSLRPRFLKVPPMNLVYSGRCAVCY